MTDDNDNTGKPRRIFTILLVLFVICLAGVGVALWLSREKPLPPPEAVRPPPMVEQEAALPPPAGKYYYGGQPKAVKYPHAILVITNVGYVVGYDEDRKDPAWVCYKLFATDYHKPPPRPKDFSPDTRTRSRVVARDYAGSGYDRGHCAPNRAIAVCYGPQAQLETFLMSNILPERPNLNRQVWERLETIEINDYAQKFKEIWIITGGVFDTDDQKLRSGVEVPRACFKIMVDEDAGSVRALAFAIPQDVAGSEDPGQFLTTVREVENQTGFDFMSELPAAVQDRVETVKAGMWK